MGVTEEEINKILEQLRKEGVTGRIVWVDPDRGNNAFDGNTPEFSLQTIAAALALCVAWRGDAIVVWPSLGGILDLNVAGVGVDLNVGGIYFIGLNDVVIRNTNAGATHIVRTSAASVKIRGLRVQQPGVVNVIGVHLNAANCRVQKCSLEGCNVGIDIDGAGAEVNDNSFTNGIATGIDIGDVGFGIHDNYIVGTNVAASSGILTQAAATTGLIANNVIMNWALDVNLNAASINIAFAHNRFRNFGVDVQLTIANGVNPVTLFTFYSPLSGAQIHINTAIAVGFKANGAPGSLLTVWVEEYTDSDANWRRVTPDSGAYKIRTTDALDVLVLSDLTTVRRFRARASVDIAPVGNISLDWTMFITPEV